MGLIKKINILFYIAISLIILFIIIFIATVIMILGTRSTIDEITNSKTTGGWIGGTFLMNPPFHLYIKTSNQNLKETIRQHNKWTNYFWYNMLIIIAAIILLNIAR